MTEKYDIFNWANNEWASGQFNTNSANEWLSNFETNKLNREVGESTCQQESTYCLDIITPQTDQIFTIDGAPNDQGNIVMPEIEAEIQLTRTSPISILEPFILPESVYTICWELRIGGYYNPNGRDWIQYEKKYGNCTLGSTTWRPNFGGEVVGGWAHLKVTMQIEDEELTDEVWFDIQGGNPNEDEIHGYLSDVLEDRGGTEHFDQETMEQIFCQESRTRQFDPTPEPNEPNDTRVLKGSQAPRNNRPIFGVPGGIGIGQVDPAPDFPEVHWNWKENIKESVNVYYGKKRTGENIYPNQQRITNHAIQVAINEINERRIAINEPQLAFEDFEVDVNANFPLTDEQRRRNIIRLYNGGFNYSLEFPYIISEDGLELMPRNEVNWNEGAVRRVGVEWREININPNYVNDVLNC